MIHVEPMRTASGDVLFYQAPFVEVFYLLKAKALRDGAEEKRVEALANTKRESDGNLRPLNPSRAFDALEDLALCVILATAAIESYANNAIGRLPDNATVELKERIGGKTIWVARNKAAMDFMRLTDKVSLAVPVLTGNNIKATEAWQNFQRIRRLRNRLVHVKREAYNDPDKPGPFGRLLAGDASSAPEDAAGVIEALEPGWIPEHARPELGLT
jgi:hypothetical protein